MRETETVSTPEAARLIQGGWRTASTCCPDAEVIPCVCRLSVRCPRHGTICIGTHD